MPPGVVGLGNLERTERGIFYLSPAPDRRSATLYLLPGDSTEPEELGTVPGPIAPGLTVAPDHTSIVYARCDRCAADIMLVEGFE